MTEEEWQKAIDEGRVIFCKLDKFDPDAKTEDSIPVEEYERTCFIEFDSPEDIKRREDFLKKLGPPRMLMNMKGEIYGLPN